MLIESSCEYFDIIGDIHGCADELERLLLKLGYEQRNGVYRPADSSRQIVFVGDLIDRGPKIRETLAIVKAMVDEGIAHIVIGNHEFNAVAYFTQTGEGDKYLRSHNKRSQQQIQATLDAFADHPEEWKMYLKWFGGLPLFLDFEHFRVVHACWDQSRIHSYYHYYQSHCINEEVVRACAEYHSIAAQAVERLTRGLSLILPEGLSIKGRDGFERKSFRVRFWSEVSQNYDDIVFQPDPLPEEIRYKPIDEAERGRLIHYDRNEKPLFIGHYWLQGEPALVAENIACLDYSAVKKGKLVAYRFDVKHPKLDAKNFVSVNSAVSAYLDIETELLD